MDLLKGHQVIHALSLIEAQKQIKRYQAERKRKGMEPLSMRLARMETTITIIVNKMEEMGKTIAGIEDFLAGDQPEDMPEEQEVEKEKDDLIKRLEKL